MLNPLYRGQTSKVYLELEEVIQTFRSILNIIMIILKIVKKI